MENGIQKKQNQAIRQKQYEFIENALHTLDTKETLLGIFQSFKANRMSYCVSFVLVIPIQIFLSLFL